MSRILFWDSGQGYSSQIAASTAITLALQFNQRLLLANGGQFGTGFEEGFPTGANRNDYSPLLEEYGMDALLRLAASKRLTTDNISDYTLSLLRGKLDLAAGCKVGLGGPSAVVEPKREIKEILQVADKYYDFVLLQSTGGRGPQQNDSFLKYDGLVAALSQSRAKLDQFFAEQIETTAFAGIPFSLVICHYDSTSRWTIQNIKRRYGCKVPLFGIPYHTGFIDAWNARDILSYFRRYRLLTRRGPEKQELVSSYYELSRNILQLTGSNALPDRKVKGA